MDPRALLESPDVHAASLVAVHAIALVAVAVAVAVAVQVGVGAVVAGLAAGGCGAGVRPADLRTGPAVVRCAGPAHVAAAGAAAQRAAQRVDRGRHPEAGPGPGLARSGDPGPPGWAGVGGRRGRDGDAGPADAGRPVDPALAGRYRGPGRRNDRRVRRAPQDDQRGHPADLPAADRRRRPGRETILAGRGGSVNGARGRRLVADPERAVGPPGLGPD